MRLTASALRFLIKTLGVGCLSKQMRLENNKVITCAHVSKRKLADVGIQLPQGISLLCVSTHPLLGDYEHFQAGLSCTSSL